MICFPFQYTMGRSKEANLCIKDINISRRHAEFTWRLVLNVLYNLNFVSYVTLSQWRLGFDQFQ